MESNKYSSGMDRKKYALELDIIFKYITNQFIMVVNLLSSLFLVFSYLPCAHFKTVYKQYIVV